jgi:membrane-bound serine protease (ClpP class)
VELSTGVIGVGLVLIGITLMVVEAGIPGWGGPGALGVVSTVAGVLFLLYAGEIISLPRTWVIALCVLGSIFVVVATMLVVRAKKVPAFVPSTLVGAAGVATSDLDPVGTVRVKSEEWTAESDDGRIEAGAKVKVVAEDGLRLRVSRD